MSFYSGGNLNGIYQERYDTLLTEAIYKGEFVTNAKKKRERKRTKAEFQEKERKYLSGTASNFPVDSD